MDKAGQRALALAARRALTAEARRAKSAALCRALLSLPELARARVILSYRALGDEADLEPLHRELLARGKTLAFPVCAEGGSMEARAVSGPAAFRRGLFGISEPAPEASRPLRPEEIDLALAPCVAFDASCARLGRGAGYYDRYLPRCVNALLAAAAFEEQRLPEVITEPHDRRMDLIATDRALFRRGEQRPGVDQGKP